MSMRYLINNGETISENMSWDYCGAALSRQAKMLK